MSIIPIASFLGFLATFICFFVTVLFHRYLYFVVNKEKDCNKVLFSTYWLFFSETIPSRNGAKSLK